MGATSSYDWRTKQDVVKYVTVQRQERNPNSELLRFCIRGNIVWSVWAYPKEIRNEKPVTVIHCDILGKYGADWGYRDLDETVGPVQKSCPISFLKLANNPPESKNSKEWREAIREQHKKKLNKPKFKVGDYIIFKNPARFKNYDYRWDFEVYHMSPNLFYATSIDNPHFGRGKEFSCKLSKGNFMGEYRVVSKEEYALIADERKRFQRDENTRLLDSRASLTV